MAAGTFTLYDTGKLYILNGDVDLNDDTIVGVLVKDGYTPATTHSTFADISAQECDSADYTASFAEGYSITGRALSNSSGTIKFDSDILNFGASVTITAKYLVIMKRAGASLVSGDLLVGYMDLNDGGGSVSSVSGAFTVDANASNGWFTAT